MLDQPSRLAMLAGITVSAAVVTVSVAPPAASVGQPDPAASRAVRALVAEPHAAVGPLPRDFSQRFGYEPRVERGLLGNPRGGCSSPVTLPSEFDSACRQHDLGYDLLRYAEQRGAPLPGSARRSLDANLARQTRAACAERSDAASRSSCLAWAALAHGAVRANSWRQRDGVPGQESARSVTALAGLTVAGIGAITLSALGFRRAMRGGRR